MRRSLLPVVALAILTLRPSAQTIPTPSEFLKMKIGSDGVLASYEQIAAYFRAIDRLTDRITLQELGRTTMGHPYLVAIITAPEHQKRMEHLRAINERLYDPRRTSPQDAERLIAEGRTIVTMQMGIHSTEVGAPQVSMELAYRMATENTPRMKQVLSEVILFLSPSHNPDGAQMVAEWNTKTAGTKHEGAGIPFLYQKYVGHDNNRDWYMFTQKESQITVSKLWNVWRPQISYDMHQMGSTAARIFVPPYIEPTDPNVDPVLRSQVTAIGTAMAAHLHARGKTGVVVHAMYDMWTPARAYVNYHGGVRLLSEVASARLASPITLRSDQLGRGIGYDAKRVSWNHPRPWRGGTWRLRDIMDYEHDAAEAVLDHAARYREQWLRGFYTAGRHAIDRRDPITGEDKPFAIVLPAAQKDPAAAQQLLWTLQFGAVEIHRSTAAFMADGRSYAPGSHVILLTQPASAFAKTLMERQRYPDLRQYPGGPPQRPYDVTAHTLPLMMGVEAVFIQKPFDAPLDAVDVKPVVGVEQWDDKGPSAAGATQKSGAEAPPRPGERGRAYLVPRDSAGIIAFNRLAQTGARAIWASAPFTAAGRRHPAGTIVLPRTRQVEAALASVVAHLPLKIDTLDGPLPEGIPVRLPRVGMYRSYVASMDEGWTRWIFEQWSLPYTTLEDRDVRAGGLRDRFDAIVLPDQGPSRIIDGHRPGTMPDEYVGGLGRDGVAALRRFVEAGGTLVTLDSAALLPIREFGLPVRNALEGLSGESGADDASREAAGAATAFYAPGSIVRTRVDLSHPIAYGADEDGIAWFEQSPAFEVSTPARAIVTYPTDGDLLLSGWLLGGEKLKGKAAVVDAPLGKGRVILFGFRPQYRAQTWTTFKLLFNALFASTSTLQ